MEVERIAAVYVLTDAIGRIRYVGKTVKTLSQRYSGHLCKARKGDRTYRSNWIRSLAAAPCIKTLFTVCAEQSAEAERFIISLMRSAGMELVNTTDGGDGTLGKRHSEETKARISASLRGQIVPREAIERMVRANLGRPLSAEHRKKISLSHATRPPLSPETRAKYRARRHSAETMAKMRASHLARQAKIRESSRRNLPHPGCPRS